MDSSYLVVLNNGDFVSAIVFSVIAALFFSFRFAKFAKKDPSPDYVRGTAAKTVPWILLSFSLLFLALIVSKIVTYPWGIKAEPSNTTMLRQFSYHYIDMPLFGWANDNQSFIVDFLGVCVCFICWTVYAFSFKRSDTTILKKTLKVIAYVLISSVIIAFKLHEWIELLFFVILIVIAFVLLYFSRVKPHKKETKKVVTVAPIESNNQDRRDTDNSRFMPASQLGSNPQATTDNSTTRDLQSSKTNVGNISIDGFEVPQAEKEQKIVLCKHCGKEIKMGSKYCKHCGKEQL